MGDNKYRSLAPALLWGTWSLAQDVLVYEGHGKRPCGMELFSSWLSSHMS